MSPDIPDEAVEAFLVAYYGRPHNHENAKPLVRKALAAAYPALTRQAVAADRVRWLNVTDAVAAERERIATAIEAAKTGHECDDDIRDDDARIARAGGTP